MVWHHDVMWHGMTSRNDDVRKTTASSLWEVQQHLCVFFLECCYHLASVGCYKLIVIVFVSAVLLYMVMEFRATPAIISIVIMTIGLGFIIASVVHSTFYWRHEKTKADMDISPYEGKKWLNGESVISQSELSTLVWQVETIKTTYCLL